jgi:hypothetical protein
VSKVPPPPPHSYVCPHTPPLAMYFFDLMLLCTCPLTTM